MRILSIETSCDDTCVAILETERQNPKANGPLFKVLSSVVSSQVEIHKKYGGVFPFLAKREHQRNLPIVLKKALKKAGFTINNYQSTINKRIDLIAVTVGPGLEPCLWVGVNFAKELAEKMDLPIVPVDHIEAHILSNFLAMPDPKKQIFPAMCLIVSGGHTQLVLMRDHKKYKLIGETLDDAAGECFDKTARILGLEYPGGLTIAKEAAKFKGGNYKIMTKLPRPMIYQKNYNFSFSGLKTAVLYYLQKMNQKTKKDKLFIIEMCNEIQQSIIDVLVKKTINATKEYNVKSIILGGGVSANEELKNQLRNEATKMNIGFLAPEKSLSTDNAVMIGISAFFNQNKKTKNWKEIKADANLRIA